MKKFFVAIWNFILALFGCKKNNVPEVPVKEDEQPKEPAKPAKLNAEHIIAVDRQNMYLNFKQDYCWFETGITMNHFMDEEDTDASIESIYNVFQTVTEHDKSFDTEVVCIAHKGSETGIETKAAFWVGDMLLNDAEIKLTFEQAYDRLMQANLPKPHSRQCVLRKELGPKEANAQYIFGNVRSHVYVDATTGNVSTQNPAYEGFEDDEEEKLGFAWLKKSKAYVGGPLGEWP